MRRVVLFLQLTVLIATPFSFAPAEAGPPNAADILRRAVARQGADKLKLGDIHINFQGQIRQEKEEHAVERDYWYRASDRSFRVRTRSKATVRESTDRGILGRDYWEVRKSGIQPLHKGNKTHRKVIKTIRKERSDFERILSMVLLPRLQKAKVTLGRPEPVLIEEDEPWNARWILGEERLKERYWVIDIRQKERPRLRLYIHTRDLTVRKAVQFHAKNAAQPVYWYYFGPYEVQKGSGLTLPLYFTVHTAVPRDTRSRKAGSFARGRIQVALNGGIGDPVLRPTQ
jgi:hypothetical protein